MRILVVAVHGVPQEVKLWQVNNYYRLMDNKREYIYRIEPGDADFMKRATLMSLADYILHTAGEDADRGGFGVRDLNLHNASWVLTRMALEVERKKIVSVKLAWPGTGGRDEEARNREAGRR